MAKAIDIEAEIPIHVVQLDGMVSILPLRLLVMEFAIGMIMM